MSDGWKGPDVPFALLLDEERCAGRSLPAALQALCGDWRLPEFAGRPYVYANFVTSRDGRISFATPGYAGGGDVSGHNGNDQWLMGLLRARADAVLVGDNTLRTEPEHIWTAEAICAADAEAFAALRQQEGRSPTPLQVFASFDGNIHAEAAVFARSDLHTVIATTAAGVVRARGLLGHLPRVELLALGDERVELDTLMGTLYSRYGVRSLLCEGGPTLYGSLLAAGWIDDEFLTLSPLVIGNPCGAPRPGLIEGVGFLPSTAPVSRLVAVRRAGDYLFLHSRYR